MELPQHIIDQLNAHEEDKRRAVSDAIVAESLRLHDLYKEEIYLARDCVKVVSMMRVDPIAQRYYIDRIELYREGLDVKRIFGTVKRD